MSFEMEIAPRNLNHITGPLHNARTSSLDEMESAFRVLAPDLVSIVKRRTPVGATGLLRITTHSILTRNEADESITLLISQPAFNTQTGFIYMPAVSGPPILGGGRRRGRRPPPGSLEAWVRIKLQVPTSQVKQVAWRISRSIGLHGTRGNPYYRRVLQDALPLLQSTSDRIRTSITAILLRSR